jgi:hypothetical protein
MSDTTEAWTMSQLANAVLIDEVPRVLALYRSPESLDPDDDAEPDEADRVTGVVAWVFSMPDGRVLLVRVNEDERVLAWCRDLESVADFWARVVDAELVSVIERPRTAAC